MQVLPALDAGPVYSRVTVPVGDDSVSVLRDRLVAQGTDLLTSALREGLTEAVPQEGAATYAEKVESQDLRLDWSRPADELLRVTRLERAWTTFRGDRLRVLAVSSADEPGSALEPGLIDAPLVGTGTGALMLERVQPAGRTPMAGADWANGARLTGDDHLGS
jgi:methionyl-tRNA formyltransferase